MFRVLVVDDEPAAVENICSIIKTKCPELTVGATAENGKEGLAKFENYMPDLIISDVKMPVMDGLEMIKAIKDSKAEVPVVLLSGCQEFEYVRTALAYGVSDYILKPVTPAGFMAAVEPVLRLLQQKVYEQRKKLARSMIIGETVKKEKVGRYFGEQAYYTAVIRERGLPRRFRDTWEFELISEAENTMFVYGRDEREALYICPMAAISRSEFVEFIEKEKDKKRGSHNFVTAVMMEDAVPRENLGDAVSSVYEEMNRKLSMGVTQTIAVKHNRSREKGAVQERTECSINEIRGAEVIKGLDRCLEKRDYGKLFEELWKLIEKAEAVKCPQLELERLVRQFASRVQQYFNSRQDALEEELMLEDAFYEAGRSRELYDSLKSILIRYWKKDKESVKLDSLEFIEEIKEFVELNLSQELTVSMLCREFNLSQSYLNLIFRKHGMESFNTYLRNARIKRAKEIMERNPQMFIKDVAMMVGYKDQFYFSRIFRAVTGISPSGYPGRQ